MFGSRIEDEFVNEVSFAAAATRGRSRWPIIAIVIIGLGAFIAWAMLFEIEEATTGLGRVVPSQSVQVIQTLEGGIVQALSVREGDFVEAGDPLIQIDDTGFSSQLGELRQRQSAILAEIARLSAEASGASTLEFADGLDTRSPTAVAAQRALFQSRRLQLETEIQVLQNRLTQRRAQIDELVATQAKLAAVIEPLSQQVTFTTDLQERRIVPLSSLLTLQSELAELEGDLRIAKASAPKLEAAVQETINEIASTRSAFVLGAQEREAALQSELAVINETIRSAADRVTRTQLLSPVRGIVNKVNNKTIGSVVQPGRDIIEIVPLEEGLLIEAEIRPQDVAFIRPGQQALVQLTAYDYLIYGSLEGTVDLISADTTTNDRGESFFKVMVRTDKNYMGEEAGSLPIIPGMVANVHVQTGNRTVMSYLMKPFLRVRSEALRER